MKKINQFLTFALGMAAIVEANNNVQKEKIIQQWNESANLPRKQKKRRRKELFIDWAFANQRLLF